MLKIIIDLNRNNFKTFNIDGIGLPKEIILSIEKRGMSITNYRYSVENKYLEVLCSKCKQWYPVFKLIDGRWENINKDYQTSINRKTKIDYFGSKCKECYQNDLKNEEVNKKLTSNNIELSEKNVSKKSGKQICTYISYENYKFLKFKVAEIDSTLNAIINTALYEYAERNPITF